MPVFNTSRFLAEALESVSRQTYSEFEFIAIDDGSSDDSPDILRKHAARDPRLLVVSRPNAGLIATRNELVDRAGGEWIAWMDSDDISHPRRLAEQIDAIATDPGLVAIGCFAQCIDPEGHPLGLETYPVSHAEIVAAQRTAGGLRFPTTMMRRSQVLSAGGFREPFSIGEDLDLLLRLGEAGNLANIPKPLYLYRQHVSSVCATLGPNWPAFRDQILALAEQRRAGMPDVLQAGGSIAIESRPKQPVRSLAAGVLSQWAESAMDHGDLKRAIRYSASSIASDPFAKSGWRALARSILTRRV